MTINFPSPYLNKMNNHSVIARIKCTLILLVLMVIDVGPIPITSTMCLICVIFRPDWFKNLIEKVYAE